MKTKLLKNRGITLVSLVITIIVMLILAGVSLSMVTGDSSVLKQAQKTAFMQEMAGYKEELESQILGKSAEYYAKNLKHLDKSKIKLAGQYMREYIPSMTDEDLEDYMIVNGELYYIGDDEFELGICAELGYKTKAENQTGDEFAAEIESGMMEELVIAMAGQAFTNYNEEKQENEEVGLKLARKVASSGFGQGVSDPWTIITKVENGQNTETYADGWYYVKAGENIPQLGTLRNSYIINYTTQRAVKFDSNVHVILSNEGNLAVKDGLVFNADPTNMDGSTTSWGGATLTGFKGNEKDENGNVISGWTPTSLNFDGVDDMLEYYTNATFQSEGITLEFYGYLNNAEEYYNLCFYKGTAAGAADSFKQSLNNRKNPDCGIANDMLTLGGTYTTSKHAGGTVQCPRWGNDFHIRIAESPVVGDVFITYVLNKDGSYKIYKDGVLATEGAFSSDYVKEYNRHLSDTKKPIQLGVSYYADKRQWKKQKIYSLRVYDKLLTPEEVMLNYKASSSYHNILVNDGKADNNNTGGDDLGSIK